MAVTMPAGVMVATEDGLQLHVPPVSTFANAIVFPGHNGTLPVIGPAKGFTVTTTATEAHVVA